MKLGTVVVEKSTNRLFSYAGGLVFIDISKTVQSGFQMIHAMTHEDYTLTSSNLTEEAINLVVGALRVDGHYRDEDSEMQDLSSDDPGPGVPERDDPRSEVSAQRCEI